MRDSLKKARRLPLAQRIQLYTMLKNRSMDEIPLFKSVEQLHKVSKRYGIFPTFMLEHIMKTMRGAGRGKGDLGVALRPFVDPLEAMIISTAETHGQLNLGLEEAAKITAVRSRLFGIIARSLLAPVAYLAVLLALLAALSMLVIPQMEALTPRSAWPVHVAFLGWMADHSIHISASILAAIAGVLFAFMVTKNTAPGPVRDRVDFLLPPWTIAREVQAAVVLNVIAMLVRTEVPAFQAVTEIQKSCTPWLRTHMDRILVSMRSGLSDTDAIAGDYERGRPGLFRPIEAAEIAFYGNSSALASAMSSLADSITASLERRLTLSMGILDKVLRIAVAVILALGFMSVLGVYGYAEAPKF